MEDETTKTEPTEEAPVPSGFSGAANPLPKGARHSYADGRFQSLLARERTAIPDPKYLDHQDFGADERAAVANWLVELHDGYRLAPVYLFLGVSILDPYLSRKKVNLFRLQLLGATGLWPAAKVEEAMCPVVQHFPLMYCEDETSTPVTSKKRRKICYEGRPYSRNLGFRLDRSWPLGLPAPNSRRGRQRHEMPLPSPILLT
ncbi:hypothetical protein AYL99_12115 [Fonsecaea erecta]|uniref:Cyclin N-terminal domain-containing protein n=1 Tax=Fonsecaea erecta TaxID=1367422 RepID=A0A178Z1N3_9EURO|nr:hypothetical protein AYL99_12115 [Fonsecaea erecta]OAP53709.1 hypothetical protein AYL99_12115 [Fonsecaea erecta]